MEPTISPFDMSPRESAVTPRSDHPRKTRHRITIGKSREEIYGFWRNLENLPRFMTGLESIQVISAEVSRWKVKLHSGPEADWTAEIVEDQPNRVIAWRSTPESSIQTEGAIFLESAPTGRGTIVELCMSFEIPGGRFTEFLTRLTGENPELLSLINLKRLKAFLETGEVPTTEGQSSGRDEDLERYPLH